MSAKIHAINSVISDHSAFLVPKLDYLRELSGGDHSFIAEILEMFITEAPQSVEQSLSYLREKNFDMLRITVHKLKSSVQVVGGYHLTNIIQEIEFGAKDNHQPDILHQMLTVLNKGIQHMVQHLCVELNAIGKQNNASA